MNDEQLAAAPGRILHFPTVLGADVTTYNLPEVTEPLRFTGPAVADIFMGKTTRWNDRRSRTSIRTPSCPAFRSSYLSFTYLLIYEQQTDGAKGKALAAFIEWMLHDGQNFTIPLAYAPLLGSVIAAEEKQLKLIKLAQQ